MCRFSSNDLFIEGKRHYYFHYDMRVKSPLILLSKRLS